MKTKKQRDAERLARAQEIADAVQSGEYVDQRADMQESWFPIRPKIKKSTKDLKKLFGED